jgi:hypothetical protein
MAVVTARWLPPPASARLPLPLFVYFLHSRSGDIPPRRADTNCTISRGTFYAGFYARMC